MWLWEVTTYSFIITLYGQPESVHVTARCYTSTLWSQSLTTPRSLQTFWRTDRRVKPKVTVCKSCQYIPPGGGKRKEGSKDKHIKRNQGWAVTSTSSGERIPVTARAGGQSVKVFEHIRTWRAPESPSPPSKCHGMPPAPSLPIAGHRVNPNERLPLDGTTAEGPEPKQTLPAALWSLSKHPAKHVWD